MLVSWGKIAFLSFNHDHDQSDEFVSRHPKKVYPQQNLYYKLYLTLKTVPFIIEFNNKTCLRSNHI